MFFFFYILTKSFHLIRFILFFLFVYLFKFKLSDLIYLFIKCIWCCHLFFQASNQMMNKKFKFKSEMVFLFWNSLVRFITCICQSGAKANYLACIFYNGSVWYWNCKKQTEIACIWIFRGLHMHHHFTELFNHQNKTLFKLTWTVVLS